MIPTPRLALTVVLVLAILIFLGYAVRDSEQRIRVQVEAQVAECRQMHGFPILSRDHSRLERCER